MAFSDTTIIYVSREIERTLGTEPNPNYLIVSNKTPYGETIKKQYPDFVTLIESSNPNLLSTAELLARPETKTLLTEGSRVLVFKNTIRVEAAAHANNWKLLNPPAQLSERIENKLSQVRWLGPLAQKYLPPHVSKVAKYITMKGNEPFVIQWAHGHTGDGTMLVRTIDELRALQEKFPERMARLTSFISGPSFTVNAVISDDRILVGNVSYQITGLAPFTDNQFSTVGNDWGLAARLLTPADSEVIRAMVLEIGEKMQKEGWRGLFGIDVIKDIDRNRVYLIEVNARQPASSTFESFLQEKDRALGQKGLTTFEAHLRALAGLPIDQDLIEINDGAQIIQHVTKDVQSIFDDVVEKLEKAGYNIVAYQNASYNADLLRIQSDTSIMDAHATFNARGKSILDTIKSSHFKISI